MTTKAALSRANPNTLSDLFRQTNIGQLMRGQIPQVLRARVPAASNLQLGTLQSVALPNDAKCASLLRATARTGMVAGEFAAQGYGVTPMSGEAAPGPNGDIVFLAADAVTNVDLLYIPERGDTVTLTLPVVMDALTIPAGVVAQQVALLMSVTTVGGAGGAKIILVPGAAPAAGQCRLNVAKAQVLFNAMDAITEATVTLLVGAAQDLDAILEAAETVM